jgi:hypothetical protein
MGGVAVLLLTAAGPAALLKRQLISGKMTRFRLLGA